MDLAEGSGDFEERHFSDMVRVKPGLRWLKGRWEEKRP